MVADHNPCRALRRHELTPPMVVDVSQDGELFLVWTEQFLRPTLRQETCQRMRQLLRLLWIC